MPLFLEQKERNKTILQSILTHGLTPRRTSSIGAVYDASHSHLLCFNGFETTSQTLENNLKTICYEDTSGFWSIAIEGVGADTKNLDREKINSGLQNGIVYLFEISPAISKLVRLRKQLNQYLLTTNEQTTNACTEYRITDSIPYQAIVAILVPRHLLATVREQYPEQHLIPVDDTKQALVSVPWMSTAGARKNFSLASVNDIFSNNHVFDRPQVFIGPDYQQGLREFISQHPAIKNIGVHLTRLSTPAMCASQTVSITNDVMAPAITSLQSFKEMKEALGFTLLLLKNMSPKQFAFLSSHPMMTLIKAPLTKNSYQLICSAKYKPLITTVIHHFDRLERHAHLISNAYRDFSSRKVQGFFKSKNDNIITLKAAMQASIAADNFGDVATKALKAQVIRQSIDEVSSLVASKGPILAAARLR